MAKKKRKYFIKQNNTIKRYFNGLPFDEGIAQLDEQKLLELVMLLEYELPDYETPTLIKALRRAWSQEPYATREMIVAFLTKPYKSLPSKQTSLIDLVLDTLAPYMPTPTQEAEIIEYFSQQAPNKITPKKIINRFCYLTQLQRQKELEKELGITLYSDLSFSFEAPFSFALKEVDITLIVCCRSKTIEALSDLSNPQISSIIQAQKELLMAQKQASIDEELKRLCHNPHCYLSPQEIYEAVTNFKPTSTFHTLPLSKELIKKIIHQELNDAIIKQKATHYDISQIQQLTIAHTTMEYKATISIELDLLLSRIWKEEPLGLKAQLTKSIATKEAHFTTLFDELISQLRELSSPLGMEQEEIESFALNFITPHIKSSQQLQLSPKLSRTILYHFSQMIHPQIKQLKKEQLLAKSIRDFKQLFKLARSLNRQIIFYAGPTNSGKTYQAMKALKEAKTGYYLAPLRLLALEGYEQLKGEAIPTSLVTGEEEIINEEASHISSTIEMLNFQIDVDVCVIDEIQLIGDIDRGWAWANALIGAPAKTVILTGSPNAIEAVKALCSYLQEPLQIIHTQRKSPLTLNTKATPLEALKPQSAIVAFSRKEVLSLKQRLSKRFEVSVVYGNLSPEVRKEEARRFRQKQSQILIATDAIAMGLNLPIKEILFARDNKFDGLRRRKLLPSEVQQIAGRAGRFGIEDEGFVGALEHQTLKHISQTLHQEPTPIALPVAVMPSYEHIELIASILQSQSVQEVIGFFVDNMEFEGPFVAADIESMLEIAQIVDPYELDLYTKYTLVCAPVSLHSHAVEHAFKRYIESLQSQTPCPYYPPRRLPPIAQNSQMLLDAEDRVREISLYLWLSFKFPEIFTQTQEALDARKQLNEFIENSLRLSEFKKRCKRCNKELDESYKFNICERCYMRQKRGSMPSRRPKLPSQKRSRRR